MFLFIHRVIVWKVMKPAATGEWGRLAHFSGGLPRYPSQATPIWDGGGWVGYFRGRGVPCANGIHRPQQQQQQQQQQPPTKPAHTSTSAIAATTASTPHKGIVHSEPGWRRGECPVFKATAGSVLCMRGSGRT